MESTFLEQCFSNALLEVIYTMTGLRMEECEKIDEGVKGDLSAVMFIGNNKGARLSLSMERKAAYYLVELMTGQMAESLQEEEVCDGIGELVNMIAGRAKIDLMDTKYRFDLSSPFVIVGDNHFVTYKKRVFNISKTYKIQNIEVTLNVAYI